MWLLLPVLAFARPKPEVPESSHQAELKRLDEEMHKLATRNTWSGVERSYLAMLTLSEEHALALTHEQHVLGAQAAQARGDVQEQWSRLKAAQQVESDLDTQGWIAMLEVTHGQVSLSVSPFLREAPTLEVLDPPDPGAMRTIEAARAQLADRRRFEGLLPLGRYRLGALQFEVDGGPPQQHNVTSAASPEPTQPHHVKVTASAPPAEASVWTAKLEPLLPELQALPGVREVDLVGPPAEVTYLEFDGSQLDALGSTPTDLAKGVRDGLGLPDMAVVARPTSLVLRTEVDPVRIESLHVPIPGGTIGLLAVASMRRGPDGWAPPPGVELALQPTADPEAVRALAGKVLSESLPEWFAAQ
jgi:hypothetical protein